MKANKAPEKIYIDVSLDSVWGMTERLYEEEVEYTRTDAFVEKACEWIKENLLKQTYIYEGEVGIGMAVFLEEFKQAMKKE